MRSLFPILALAAVVAGGCGTGSSTASIGPSPSPTPSEAPASPSPTIDASPSPSPSAVALTDDEAYLRSGIRNDAAIDCVPRRDDLPTGAIAGLECSPGTALVERIGVYLFPDAASMLAAYRERMVAEGVTLGQGLCFEGEGDTNYVPGEVDLEVAYRHGCFINEAGRANYRATFPDQHVYLGILGNTDDTSALEQWAWEGNEDTPGSPTAWLAAPR